MLAAVISPLLYKAGKNFAEVFAHKDTTDSLVWLGKKAAKAEFDTYFKRSLMLAALLGLWPLIHSLKSHRRQEQDSIWASLFQRPSASLLSGPRQCGTGFFVSAGAFLIMALLIQILGWRIWDPTVSTSEIPSIAFKSIQSAIAVSLVEEVLFRGFLMAIFLRAFRPSVAIIAVTLLFTSVHFLQPPSDTVISNPWALTAGFEMLSLVGQRFLEPQLIAFGFSTLFLTGLILAIARHKSGSLWLSLGLHAGLIFSLKFYHKLTECHPEHPKGAGIYLGESTLEGILPLAILLTIGIIVVISLRKSACRETPSP
ncbi:CPBP family intramembrane metalloprotease [Akkermansiaceae bacterium]|nr:CPBP family intramembrane metalloprotease [Akkermansiaceae bacterium]